MSKFWHDVKKSQQPLVNDRLVQGCKTYRLGQARSARSSFRLGSSPKFTSFGISVFVSGCFDGFISDPYFLQGMVGNHFRHTFLFVPSWIRMDFRYTNPRNHDYAPMPCHACGGLSVCTDGRTFCKFVLQLRCMQDPVPKSNNTTKNQLP